ncbi:MAG: tripartite tricarboxylate transporter substrate binding protein [Polaromonas sp.]|nr:tripartite tricarboxylate transporter substrate binding protein [Polaromonas sp.]
MKKPSRRRFALTTLRTLPAIVALTLLGAGTAGNAWAQAYPNKPIRLIVPQAPGGGSDTIGRYVADKLGQSLGQTVVVENKPGAAGMLGAEYVKNAPADGYTLLLSAIDTITAPMVSVRKPFDGVKDFAPVTQLAQSPNVWLVGPSFEGKTMADLVTQAKANPDKIDYASSGVGGMQHLAGEMLTGMANVKLGHVPYKGGPPGFADVVGGRIPVMVSGIQGALPQIKAGKVRGLAVTGKKRSSVLPDLPTVGEALNLPNYEAMNWQGLVFPAGTPQPVVDKVAAAVIAILAQPDTREKLVGLGYEPVGNTPAQFSALMADEQKRWSAIIKTANITSD